MYFTNMKSFRSRVFLLGLGMLFLMTIQIFRLHSGKGSVLISSDEDIYDTSKKDLFNAKEKITLKFSPSHVKRSPDSKSERKEHFNLKQKESSFSSAKGTDASFLDDSENHSKNSLETESNNKKLVDERLRRFSKNSNELHKKGEFKDIGKDKDVKTNNSKDFDRFRNSPTLTRNALISMDGSISNKLRENLRRERGERIKASDGKGVRENSLWFNSGELGLDFPYYNISLRSVSRITDNITIDISRFMTGWPIRQAPIFIHNRDLCDVRDFQVNHDGPGSAPFLLVIVPSLPKHNEIRTVIRETWGSAAYNGGYWAGRKMNETVRLLFVFGGTSYSYDDKAILHREAKMYSDILVMDFVDSYQNLSIKITNALRWSGKYCSGVRHLMKVDEDTYVHLPQLVTLLKHVEKGHERFVLGHQHKHHYPKVVRKGRWRVGIEYPLPYYPRYIYGHSYVVSGTALQPMLRVLNRIPGIKNEDAFITGIVAKLNNIPRLHSRAFAGNFYAQVLCNITKGYYVSLTFCCKEHLRTLYRHAVEGRCEKTTFNHIPTRHCRFFKDRSSHKNTTELKKGHLSTKNLEHLLNVSAVFIEEMGKMYFRDEEDAGDREKTHYDDSEEDEKTHNIISNGKKRERIH